MPGWLKEDTATTVKFGPFVDVSDGATLETGLTLGTTNFRLSKNGGNYAAKNSTTATTHDELGDYDVSLSATDTNTAGRLRIIYKSTAALVVWDEYMVLPANVYDSLVADTDNLDINLVQLGGSTQSQADLKDFADAGYDPSGNRVNAVLTAGSTISLPYPNLSSAGLVDEVWDEVLTGGTHNVVNSAGRRLRSIQEAGGYSGGAIYIDTVNGTAGTTEYENGVDSNPVDSIADANTLAASLGISTFVIAPGSSITLAAAQQNQAFIGADHWTLALGGQNIDGSTFVGATVTGTGTNTSGTQYFKHCMMGAVTLPADTHVINSGVSGTQTIGESGDYFWDNCHSAVAGTGTPNLDINSVANVNINWRHYSGGVQVDNAVATTTMSYEADGQIVVAATCTSLTLVVRGNCSITDSGTTTSLTQDAALTVNTIADQTWEEAIADHSGTAGSVAEALAAAGGAGDPWITALPGAYSTGTAGNILGNRLNAAITTRLASGSTATIAFPNTTVGTVTVNSDMRGTDLALLAASAPTNWSNMSMTTGGVVSARLAAGSTATLAYANLTVGTVTANTDMRGTDSAFPAASAPTNFSNMALSTGGVVQSNLVTSASTARGVFADSFLTRGLATGATTGTRTVQAALRASRNRVKITGTTGTVYEEDDTTVAWKFTATRASTATEPLVESNPA